MMDLKALKIDVDGGVAWLRLNRPSRANALDHGLFMDLARACEWVDAQSELRVAVLAGEGKHFCAGADIALLEDLRRTGSSCGCAAEARDLVRREILVLQAALTAIEQLRIPVISAVHGACIGAGVDLIAACDLRYAAADARFCIKEVDMGIVADVGTLQRLRHVVGLPILSELAYTAETFSAARAHQIGLIGSTYESRDTLFAGVEELARRIAAKPALTVRGIKHNLLYARDHSVADALNYVATWNASAILSEDMERALQLAREAIRG